MSRLAAVLSFVFVAVVPLAGFAEDLESGNGREYYHFEVDPLLDGAVTAGAAGFALMANWNTSDAASPWCGLNCSENNLNALDRSALTFKSSAAATASNATLWASMGLPVAVYLGEAFSDDDGGEFAGKLLLLGESIAVTSAVVEVMKYGFSRPRPVAYDGNASQADRMDPTAARSFPSGHTAMAFAAATAFATMSLSSDDADEWYNPVVGSALFSLAAATGCLRVFGGKHFWTDVGAGALVGIGTGYFVPRLHREAGRGGVEFALQPGVLDEGHAGLLVTIYGI